jgi:hypothetical protein
MKDASMAQRRCQFCHKTKGRGNIKLKLSCILRINIIISREKMARKHLQQRKL